MVLGLLKLPFFFEYFVTASLAALTSVLILEDPV